MMKVLDDKTLIDDFKKLKNDDGFCHYLYIAQMTRKLWWLSYDEVLRILKTEDEKYIGAFLLVAQNSELEFFKKIAIAVGNNVSAVMLDNDDEKRMLFEGRLSNESIVEEARMKGLI
jgi:hypothetical protein